MVQIGTIKSEEMILPITVNLLGAASRTYCIGWLDRFPEKTARQRFLVKKNLILACRDAVDTATGCPEMEYIIPFTNTAHTLTEMRASEQVI